MRHHIRPKPPLDYRNQVAVPEFEDYFHAWKKNSEHARQNLRCELDVRYGPGPRRVCDVFPSSASGAPVFLFIHGGWWYFLDKSDFSYIAEPFVARDAVVINVNYPLAPTATMSEIVESMREALLWARANVSRWGGDPGNLSVGGHSAGGHLSTMLSLTDWTGCGLASHPIRANCTVSGLYDLVPILDASQNERIQLTRAEADKNSPIDRVVNNGTRHVACVGLDETAGFLWQHRTFLEACAREGASVTDIATPGKHHFNIIDELGRPDSSMFRALWSEMNA